MSISIHKNAIKIRNKQLNLVCLTICLVVLIYQKCYNFVIIDEITMKLQLYLFTIKVFYDLIKKRIFIFKRGGIWKIMK